MKQSPWNEFERRKECALKDWAVSQKSFAKEKKDFSSKGSGEMFFKVLLGSIPRDKWWSKALAMLVEKKFSVKTGSSSRPKRRLTYPVGKRLLGQLGGLFEKKRSGSSTAQAQSLMADSSERTSIWEKAMVVLPPLMASVGVPLLRMWIKKRFPSTGKYL